MTYNDLKTEELFVEASAIKFYMRHSGWVNPGEIIGSRSTVTVQETYSSDSHHDTSSNQPLRQRNWIEWVRSL
ncbi:hypothetical protein C8N40_102301 [Pontibacter mucosus]|uniref:Uncharacterized protein n=1 Tax=Pontibacter mucosus TaxID=1649266 RepID=A0A2T5YPT2_9BACT|nr:hypothetical protein [Pontibacter mucosus]PTX21325.1 hypothetical protein C8N40_102301 [Pontibacter mucosus]